VFLISAMCRFFECHNSVINCIPRAIGVLFFYKTKNFIYKVAMLKKSY
jgi:hypothetical protein